MKMAMQVVVVVLLLLSGAALVMGLILFQQREMLKGRTLKLEAAIKQVAGTLEAGDDSDQKLVIPDDQLKTYKQKPGGPAAMDIPLNRLGLAAKDQLGRLNGTRATLKDTRETLAKTEDELRITQTNLATAKAEIVSLNATVAARDATIVARDDTIKDLERDKIELNTKIEGQNTRIANLEAETNKFAEQVVGLETEVKKLKDDLARRTTGDQPAVPVLAKGQHGKVLYVDPEWNFLIISLSTEESQKNVGLNLELIIHRADQLVGKVRVKAIENNMAVADIVRLQLQPQKGDFVIY